MRHANCGKIKWRNLVVIIWTTFFVPEGYQQKWAVCYSRDCVARYLYFSILTFLRGLRIHPFFSSPSEGKSRYSVYLHTFTAHKVCYNMHYLFTFSKSRSNFELLFTTQGGEFLTTYIVSRIGLATFHIREPFSYNVLSCFAAMKTFTVNKVSLKHCFILCSDVTWHKIGRTGVGKLWVVL
jgi:hypothetical protein